MKLLFVDSCISQRGADSRTRRLAAAFLEAFAASHPDWELETVEVGALELKPFTAEMLSERDALASVGAWDAPVFDLARQFRAADAVVVAAPYWDLSYPAALRIYMEDISANGLCYHYEADGCHGDCRGQWLVYLTSGGDLSTRTAWAWSTGGRWRPCSEFPGLTTCSPGGWTLTRPRRRSCWRQAVIWPGAWRRACSRWRRGLSAWWGPRPAARPPWACCLPNGMGARWSPPTPCRFTGG